MAATHSKNAGTETCLKLCQINFHFNYNVKLFENFYFYVDSYDHITHFHCLFDYLRWALAQRTWHHDCIELMYSFLLERNREKQRFKFHLLMQWQTVLSDSSFPKYSSTHVAIFNTAVWQILMQCHLRTQRSCTFTEVSCLVLHRLRFCRIPWIFLQCYVW